MSQDLREQREKLVREHMESENHHDFETTLGTFEHPRYEIVPTGDVFDGAEAVQRYFDDTRTAFPDQRNELIALHHADDGVIVEFELKGTHQGPLRGIPATGKEFTCRTAAFFLFEGEKLVCERVYFDAATIMAQLGLIQPAPTLQDGE
ncbi:MAG TPA: ester cyclase [Thermoleophilaceae bacterium]|nr:ester cyclase [Thermoleophilaceae bacterium]